MTAGNPGVEIIRRGKYKTLDTLKKQLLKRRQAIEPLIGHTKADHRMDLCWLQGATGDALHAISCAAGYNIRWLLRGIAALGVGALLLVRIHGVRREGRRMAAAPCRLAGNRRCNLTFSGPTIQSRRTTSRLLLITGANPGRGTMNERAMGAGRLLWFHACSATFRVANWR